MVCLPFASHYSQTLWTFYLHTRYFGLGCLPPYTAIASVHTTSATSGQALPAVSWVTALQASTSADPMVHQSGVPANTVSPVASPPAGVSLSPATASFPQKLVEKILSGQFVEMRDLLADNISLIHLALSQCCQVYRDRSSPD